MEPIGPSPPEPPCSLPAPPRTPGAAFTSIIASASKIVFLMLAVTACITFAMGQLSEDKFMILASVVFTFYFANKGETSGSLPYAGK